MSTRSRIGYVREDGRIESIYCHFDGYPTAPHGVGYKLKKYYTDIADIKKLMALGDLSSLGTTPVANPLAWPPDNVHREELCDTYASRGAKCPSDISTSESVYKQYTDDCGGEYCYLFKDGQWFELFSSSKVPY